MSITSDAWRLVKETRVLPISVLDVKAAVFVIAIPVSYNLFMLSYVFAPELNLGPHELKGSNELVDATPNKPFP